jgi:hypothetical protein
MQEGLLPHCHIGLPRYRFHDVVLVATAQTPKTPLHSSVRIRGQRRQALDDEPMARP